MLGRLREVANSMSNAGGPLNGTIEADKLIWAAKKAINMLHIGITPGWYSRGYTSSRRW